MFFETVNKLNIILVLISNGVYGQLQIFGDIYTNSWDLKDYNVVNISENQCFKEQPAFYYQTKEHKPIAGNGSTPFYQRLKICCKGFVRSIRKGEECIADCSETSTDNCRHGLCRSPQNCECFEGFVKNTEGNCKHICPVACENGRCLLDETCICKPGYSLDPATRKYCIPDCSHIACGLNQQCIGPGQCVCNSGYSWVDGLGCQPICMPHCGHGRCIAPNKCECFEGYIKRPGRHICEAECFMNCDNGFCESRYKCQCHLGFKFDERTATCLPDCQQSCQHGVCLAPGVCKCFEGYNLQDNNCIPFCENGCGLYGQCIAPNICACGRGHQRCLAGICSARGKCLCSRGMSHFIDHCLYSGAIFNTVFNYDQREFYNKQLKYEFDGLIGRMFKF